MSLLPPRTGKGMISSRLGESAGGGPTLSTALAGIGTSSKKSAQPIRRTRCPDCPTWFRGTNKVPSRRRRELVPYGGPETKPGRRPPVQVAEQAHRRRDEQRPNQGRIERDRERQTNACGLQDDHPR